MAKIGDIRPWKAETPQVDQPTPVATTVTVVDSQGVVPRFTNEIWPAINAYNSDTPQGSPGYQQYIKVISPGMDTETWTRLRSAVQGLGTVREADQTRSSIVRDERGSVRHGLDRT